MSETRGDARRVAIWGVAIVLCGVSLLAAVATGAGVYFFAGFARQNPEGIVLAWLAWMMAGFSIAVANTGWSAKLVKAPTWRGFKPVVATSAFALLSFLVLKAATP